MPFDAAIERNLVSALSTEEVSRDLIKAIQNESVAMTLFRRVTMSRNQTRMPVVAALPMSYFVNGDTGLKSTTDMSWENKYLNAEEIATIIPIPDAVLDDTDYDIWAEVRPAAIESAVRVLDNAILFGVNRPSSWASDIVTAATSASQTVARGTSTSGEGLVAGDISDAFSLVEGSGYAVNGAVANVTYKGFLRNARNADGDKLPEVSPTEVYGVPVRYPAAGLWPTGTSKPEMIVGDFSEGIVGIRQDFTWKLLDQAVIQDNTGKTIFNLPQQDMIALRMVFRVGFQVANTINYQEETAANRYPFAVITTPAS